MKLNINKIKLYMGMARVAFRLVEGAQDWYEKVTDAESDGGDDITLDEYFDLVPLFEDAIKDGLGLAVNVSIEPKEVD